MDIFDVIIIGAGPAGLTAAIYAGRQGMNAIVLEMMTGAGSGYMVPAMENYPGFEMISGKDLLDKMKKQAEKHVEIINMGEVISIDKVNSQYSLTTNKGDFKAKSVIIATGSRHRRLKVPGETQYLGRGVCYCATCDGPLYADKDVLMIGGGNAAVQEALYLESIGCRVSIVHRRDELRAEKYLQEKLEEKNIPIIWNSVVEEIKGDMVLNQIVLHNIKNDERIAVNVQGIFIAIGEEPSNKAAISIGVKTDVDGYVITDKDQCTTIPFIYAAGDITGGIKQWVVACAEGAVAALSAHRDLME